MKARALMEKGLFQEALHECEVALSNETEGSSVLIMAGDILASLGRSEEAANRYHEALDAYPESVDALMGLGDLTAEADWYRKALEACEMLMSDDETDGSFLLFQKSDILSKLGMDDEAEEAMNAALDIINELDKA